MKIKMFIIMFMLSVLLNQHLIASVNDICGTTSGSSAPYLPTTGTIKVFIVFAQFKDDPNTSSGGSNGWAKNSYPSWANNFINSSTGGSYPWNNLSHYFNEMSNGDFQVIGDVYNSLVITDNDFDDYATIGEVNREVLLKVDPYVDFSEYDNLDGNSFGSDGKVDFIYIIYRNVEKRNNMMKSGNGYYSGIAHLELSSTITTDGVQIVSNSWIGGGVQQRSGYNGRDYTMYTAAHELGHYLFGGGHISGAGNLVLMNNGPAWNASKGMMSWEREKLGWINYTTKSTDGSVILSDYMTADQVYKVPVNGSSEYFLIENRKHLSPHDKAGDTGIYIYHITNGTNFPPTVDVECADGNWNFSINTSTQTLTRTTENVNGKDEMNYFTEINGVKYACYTPIYYENAAWGDDEDAFDLTFNNVFSPVSNPRSTNGGTIEFTLEVTGTNTVTFYIDGDGSDEYVGKPSKIQNLGCSINNIYPNLTWSANQEPDIDHYEIWKKNVSSDNFFLYTTTTNNSYVDMNNQYESVVYMLRVVDSQSKKSVYSEEVYCNPGVISSNTTWSGNIILKHNITVNSGVTLTVNSNTNITFENNASLIVNGSLDVNGAAGNEAVFDFVSRNSSTQNGIKLNYYATAQINHAVIKNAYRGIWAYRSDLELINSEIHHCQYGLYFHLTDPGGNDDIVTNNYIHDCSSDGIYSYYSNGDFSHNQILNNGYAGIYFYGSGHQNIAPYDDNSLSIGHNKITGSYIGVSVYHANPNFGRVTNKDYGGYNHIDCETEMRLDHYSHVYAQHNYWGSSPYFQVWGGSTLDHSYALPAPPSTNIIQEDSTEKGAISLQLSQQFNNVNSTSTSINRSIAYVPSISNEFNQIKRDKLALKEIDIKINNNTRIKLLTDIIALYPDSSISYLALDLLHRYCVQTKCINQFEQFVTKNADKNERKNIYGLAELLLAMDKKYDRLATLNNLVKKYHHTPIVELILFDKFMYYLNEADDITRAKTASGQLKDLFPESESYYESVRQLGKDVEDNSLPSKSVNQNLEEENVIVKEYRLLGNYPNPFNPSTTVNYSLPRQSTVRVEIYNIRGRKVNEFIYSSQSAGAHRLTWNGQNRFGEKVSSGLYIVRFHAESLAGKAEVFQKSIKVIMLK